MGQTHTALLEVVEMAAAVECYKDHEEPFSAECIHCLARRALRRQEGPLCDMREDCLEPITHLDEKGYVYCTEHGIDRRSWRPCRKLRPHELRRIMRGEPVERY